MGRSIRREIAEEKAARGKSLARGIAAGYAVMAASVAAFLSTMNASGDGRFLPGSCLFLAACASAFTLCQSFRLMAFHRSPAGFVSFLFMLLLAGSTAVDLLFPCGFRPYLANESSAIASLKTLVTAEEQYKASPGNGVYATLTQLSATTPQYIDNVLGAGKKSGYSFTLTVGTPAAENWTAVGVPEKPGRTGDRRFFADSSGVIRFHKRRLATSADSAIE